MVGKSLCSLLSPKLSRVCSFQRRCVCVCVFLSLSMELNWSLHIVWLFPVFSERSHLQIFTRSYPRY